VDDGKAAYVSPANASVDNLPGLMLSWSPGIVAASHDVYLGTDFDGVKDADTSSPQFQDNLLVDVNSYLPSGPLMLGQTYYWRIDALNPGYSDSKGDVWSFSVDDGKATYLSPANGSVDTLPQVTLSWSPGIVAGSHNVYLGTDFGGVRDADTSSAQYKDNLALGSTTYPAGPLDFGETYYWRVDEVNPGYSDSKGDLWSFNVADYVVLDDMESYDTGDNPIGDVWLYMTGNWTGSWLYLGVDPCDPVHGGAQSMKYEYNNDGGSWGIFHYYSEVVREFADPCDWSVSEIKVLTLYFYGNPDNDAGPTELMYVGLHDGSSYAQAGYGDNGEDMNDIKISEWQQWNIRLQDFNDAGVDLSEVSKMYIGFGDRENLNPGGTPGGSGVVCFDDIRLYPRKCAASLAKPTADFDSDCLVNFEDFAVLGSQWLQSPGIPSADIAPESPDGVVDWRDLAVLGNEWLEQQLWP